MPVNYNNNVKNSRLGVVNTALGTAGRLVIGTDALAGGAAGVLASIPLQNPAATVANAVLTLAGLPLTTNASATGTASKAELRHSDGTVVVSGLTVNTANADIIINATAISNGQTVQVTAGTITHP